MAPEAGYFPEGSMLRHVQSHRAVGQTYGQRALIIGATHPVPYVGTSQATLAKERPFERLARTALAFETVFFAPRTEADRLLAAVHGLHQRVRGELDRDEGSFGRGTPYDAFDPELMLWTMAMLADSSRVAFETLVRPLTAGEKDDLWADWVRFGELFGMPRSVAPPGAAAFEQWMRDWYASGRMHLTAEARVVGLAIARDMPVPWPMTPGIKTTNLVVQGMLPPAVRDLYGLRWSPAHALAWRAVTAGVRGSRHVVPDRVRLGDNSDLHRLVIRSERAAAARGRRTMDLPAV
ncbi:oxygenase MpaB family protein [Nocardioides sp. QY071]|uniref:oxygenase MpaB family protein n=1 Tax=Nocardioides sp. QY071 TaxID=3044187 RepID=UPI00249BAB5F|nr:oxygenase MpaB family protein [Nocardioides sp. QY071]WGY03146.1 oxygenase MpaB family protein [Nocardioides sp. QY071]